MATTETIKSNLVAHYSDPSGNKDKVYIAQTRFNDETGMWDVIGVWGKRGRYMNNKTHASCKTKADALAQMLKLFRTKLAKGYVDIESPHYSGPVTLESVRRELVSDDQPNTRSLPKKTNVAETQEEFVVRCVNNKYIQEMFDKGMTYIAKNHSDKDILCVMDVYGKWQECLASRFERTVEE